MIKPSFDLITRCLVYAAAALTVCFFVSIISYIMINGAPHLSTSLFSLTYTSENVSLLPALVTTLFMCVLSLLLAIPFGVLTAVYLIEYAKKGSKLIRLIRLTTETLAGIPSIVYGLFGLLFFVTWLKWGFSLFSGAFTLAIMILPAIMRTTEEALKAVPDAYREGAYGLGAGRLRVVFLIVLPCAIPGILAGVILATGRIIGETAALIYTAGTVAQIPDQLFASGRTLSVHMYALSSEGLHTNEAFATAVILLLMVLLINALSTLAAKKLAKE